MWSASRVGSWKLGHLRLVVTNEHGGPCIQCFFPSAPAPFFAAAGLIDSECHARGQPHGPLERSPHSPLAQPTVPDCSEEDAGKDAIARAYHQQQERGDAEGCEGCSLAQAAGQHETEYSQQHGERDRGGGEVEKPAHAGS